MNFLISVAAASVTLSETPGVFATTPGVLEVAVSVFADMYFLSLKS
jgi:hypothetical protein